MKKIFILSPFIAFFLGFFFLKLTCHAQALPSLSIDSFSLIEGGAKDLFNIGFTSNNLLPEEDAFLNSQYYFDAWNVGFTSLISFDDDDVTITELTDQEKDILLGFGNLYDSYGNALSPSDNIYLGTIDNGFFSGTVYIDDTGTILGDNSSLTNRLYNIKYGGHIKDTVEWIQLYSDISADIFDNSYILPFDANFDITDRSLYLWYGKSAGTNRSEAYIFVPDIYNPGVSVANGYTNGRAPNYIYFNDNSGIVYETIRTNTSPYVGAPYIIENGTFTLNNYTYTHRLNIRWVILSTSSSDHNAFINSGAASSEKVYNFNSNQFTWYTSLLDNTNFAAFKQLQFEDSNTKVLSFDDTFDYNELKELLENLNNLHPSVNNEFDYSKPINEYNYYNYTYITEGNNLSNSELPLPNGNNSPFPSLDPVLNFEAVTQPATSQIYESFFNFQIPFVENLFNRYPFCIPWDIKNFFMGFVSTPQAPAWDFDYTISILGESYTTHFEGDLSDFDPLARIFRNLIAISFIIFLAVYSYFKHS